MLKTKTLFNKLNNICKFDSDNINNFKDDVCSILSKCNNLIKDAHNKGLSGTAICNAHSKVVDKLITHLYNKFVSRREKLASKMSDNFCIVALGGYGRNQLCPKSDVDLIFMYSSKVSDELRKTIIDEIAYPLWDCGIALSQSSRSYRESILDSGNDFIFRNSMIDARLVCGNERLFATFEVKFKAFCLARKTEHFNELMRLKRDRHARYGWSAYLQEPNIKNGVGGLRDAQTMVWKTFLNFGVNNIRELASRSIISAHEYKSILKAYDFLLRVRNEMHYIFDRPIEILDLATQVKIAHNLGFGSEDEISSVEEFMRKVYFSFKAIDNVSKISRKRMRLTLPSDVIATMRHMGNKLPANKKFYSDGFLFYNGEVTALRKNVFKKNPNLLIKIFELTQQYSSVPSDKLEVLIKDSVSLIDKSVRNNLQTNYTFLNILQNKGNVFPTLELMHFWGVLGAFVPEFGNITCMVQHEFYHYYTIDVHTLNTISHLDKIFFTTNKKSIYWEYHKVLLSTPSPILLYLMLFLHDIGKRDGIKGHAEVGAEIGKLILKRMKVPDSDIEIILFIIKNHLQMARFWQSNDIEDEASIEKFAKIIETEDKLKYLYVLTFCDAMGTAKDFWNSYKQGLHNRLYRETLGYLKTKSANVYLKRQKNRIIEEALLDKRAEGLEDIIVAQAQNLPRNYFSFHGRNDLLMHAKMINELKENKSKKHLPILEWHDEPNASVSRLYVASMEDTTLFSILVGVITLSGFDILGSKIFKCEDGIILDAFYIHTNADGIEHNDILKSRFKDKLESVISEKINLDKLVDEMFYLDNDKKAYHIRNVSVRKESKKVILDIVAYDKIGLLYKIAKLIDSCGYDIVFARINTEQSWATNTFYLTPRENALPQSTLLKRLKQTF